MSLTAKYIFKSFHEVRKSSESQMEIERIFKVLQEDIYVFLRYKGMLITAIKECKDDEFKKHLVRVLEDIESEKLLSFTHNFTINAYNSGVVNQVSFDSLILRLECAKECCYYSGVIRGVLDTFNRIAICNNGKDEEEESTDDTVDESYT